MPAPRLEVVDIHKSYTAWPGFWGLFHPTTRRVLAGIEFALPHAGIIGLYGANGAGKTTLLHILAGLLHADRGTIRLDGTPVSFGDIRLRRSVVLGLGESRSFYWRLSVRQNLDFFSALAMNHDGSRVDGVMETFHLADLASQTFSTLSAGQMRRLSLARAFLFDAPIRLFDEPTRDLDAEARSDFLDHLASRRAVGESILLVSHRLEELQDLCDAIWYLDDGTLRKNTGGSP